MPTRKQFALATLGLVGVASVYATYQVRSFLSHLPFAACADANSLTKGVDLTNKVILITGTTSGVGMATVTALLPTNAKIIMAVRNVKKAQNMQKTALDPNNKYIDNIDIMKLDLSSIKSIDEFAMNFRNKYNKLDILICNAGVSPQRDGMKTMDGYELAFGTNHLGHMHLSLSLVPELKNADNYGRILILTGDVFRFPGIYEYNLNKLNDHQQWAAYAHSKLCNVMFVNEFNRKYPFDIHNKESIFCVSLHPGVGKTELLNDRDESGNVISKSSSFDLTRKALQYLGDTLQQLAYTSVYLSIEDINKLQPGGYYCVKEVWDAGKPANDKQECEKLWDMSMKYINNATRSKL